MSTSTSGSIGRSGASAGARKTFGHIWSQPARLSNSRSLLQRFTGDGHKASSGNVRCGFPKRSCPGARLKREQLDRIAEAAHLVLADVLQLELRRDLLRKVARQQHRPADLLGERLEAGSHVDGGADHREVEPA